MMSKATEKEYLFVGADLHVGKKLFTWHVKRCPFCGHKHVHWADYLDIDPRECLSLMDSQCVPDHVKPEIRAAAHALNFHDDCYILVDRDPGETSKIIAGVAKARAAGTHNEGLKS